MKKLISLVLALALACTVLVGCSGNKEEEKTADGYAKTIYLYNWSEYMSQEVLDLFEEEYGIKVIETTFESNDEMLAKLMAGGDSGFDIVVPTNFHLETLLANDLLAEIDWNNVPNMANLDPAYLNPSYDPEQKYSVPYMGTLTTWIANMPRLQKLGVEVHKMTDIADPKLKGEVLMSDDATGNIGQALIALGYEPYCQNVDEIMEAKDWLISINDNVKAYAIPADACDSVARGEAALAYAYSGNIMMAMQQTDDVQLVMDQEEVSLSIDTFVILKSSQHKREAELFIDFLLRPEISAMLTTEFPYVCFNAAAVEYLPEELANSPMVVLADSMKERIYMLNNFSAEGSEACVVAMTEVKTSRG